MSEILTDTVTTVSRRLKVSENITIHLNDDGSARRTEATSNNAIRANYRNEIKWNYLAADLFYALLDMSERNELLSQSLEETENQISELMR